MAENDREVKIRIALEGLVESLGGLKNLQGQSQQLFDQYRQGAQVMGGMGGAMSLLTSAFQGIISPIGLAATAIGAFAAVSEHAAANALETWRNLRQLMSISGETAQATEVMAHSFELAGVNAGGLNMAMFRLGMEIERGGKQLKRFGIETTDAFGNMKTEGMLLMEVRDRLSDIGDASTRNAVLMQMFGRAGRSLAPIMALNKEKFAEFVAAAKESSSVTDSLMTQSAGLARAQAELAHQWEKLNNVIAEGFALRGRTLRTEIESTWVSGIELLVERLMSSATELKATAVTGGPQAMAGGLIRAIFFGSDMSGQRVIADAEATIKKTQEALTKTGGRGIITEGVAKQHEAEIKEDAQFRQRKLALEEQYNLMNLKMQTGSTAEALRLNRAANEERIKIARETAQKIAEEEAKRSLPGAPESETAAKARKAANREVQALEAENRKLLLSIRLAEVDDAKKALGDELKARQLHIEQVLKTMESQVKREKAVLETSGADKVEIAEKSAKMDEDVLKKSASIRTEEIDQQIAEQQKLAAQFSDVYEVQRETQQKIAELQGKRLDVERETNDKIIESRKQMIQKMNDLAQQEASIGETLEGKAIARLQKRKVKYASQADIVAEERQMILEAQQTAQQFGRGGAVKLEDLQLTRELRSPLKGLNELGSTAERAAKQLQQMIESILAGRREFFSPSGSGGTGADDGGASISRSIDEMIKAGREWNAAHPTPSGGGFTPGGGVDSVLGGGGGGWGPVGGGVQVPGFTQRLDGMSSEVEKRGMEAINSTVSRIPDIMNRMFDKFSDGFIRKLEFEASAR